MHEDFQKLVDYFKNNVNNLTSDSGTINLIKNIKLILSESNSCLKLQDIALISGDNRIFTITPYDNSNSKDIQKALWDSKLGTIETTSKSILLKLPPLTVEFKQKIVEQIKLDKEDTKIKIRQLRQKFLDNTKREFKGNEDKIKKQTIEIQKHVDKSNTDVEVIFNNVMRNFN